MQYIHYPYEPGSAPEEAAMPLNVKAQVASMLDAHDIVAFISVPGADLRKSQIAASAQILTMPHLIFGIELGMSATVLRADGCQMQFDCDDTGKLESRFIPAQPEYALRKPAAATCGM